jgi:hypothetical protein
MAMNDPMTHEFLARLERQQTIERYECLRRLGMFEDGALPSRSVRGWAAERLLSLALRLDRSVGTAPSPGPSPIA